MKTVFVLGLVVLMTYGSSGLPVDDPAASAVPSPAEEVIAVPVAASPEVAPEIAPVAPIAPSSPVEPAPPNQQGNGYITHQKNPDGSTITITRFNGQIPASAFPAPGNQFGQIHQQIVNSHLNNVAQIYRNAHFYNPRPIVPFPQYPQPPHLQTAFHHTLVNPYYQNYYQPYLNQLQFSHINLNPAFGSPFGNPSPYFWPSPWGYPGAINYNPQRV